MAAVTAAAVLTVDAGDGRRDAALCRPTFGRKRSEMYQRLAVDGTGRKSYRAPAGCCRPGRRPPSVWTGAGALAAAVRPARPGQDRAGSGTQPGDGRGPPGRH